MESEKKKKKESGRAENPGSKLAKNDRKEAAVWASTALWWPSGT